MRLCQTIWFVSLSSTSLIISIAYWLFAYFRVYYQLTTQTFTNDISSCQQSPSRTYFENGLKHTQCITLILCIVSVVYDIIIIIAVLKNHKKNRKHTQKSPSDNQNHILNQKIGQDSHGRLHKYQTQNNQQQIHNSQPNHNKQIYNHNKLCRNQTLFSLLFILFIFPATNFGHNIKMIDHIKVISNCYTNVDKSIINYAYEENIILAILSGYCVLSVLVRFVINFIAMKKSMRVKRSYIYMRRSQTKEEKQEKIDEEKSDKMQHQESHHVLQIPAKNNNQSDKKRSKIFGRQSRFLNRSNDHDHEKSAEHKQAEIQEQEKSKNYNEHTIQKNQYSTQKQPSSQFKTPKLKFGVYYPQK